MLCYGLLKKKNIKNVRKSFTFVSDNRGRNLIIKGLRMSHPSGKFVSVMVVLYHDLANSSNAGPLPFGFGSILLNKGALQTLSFYYVPDEAIFIAAHRGS